MKTRTGFVSNSSSSSYLLIVPIATHETVMNELDEFAKGVIDYVSFRHTVFDVECNLVSWFTSDYGTFDGYEIVDMPERWNDLGPYGVLDYYQEEAKKRDKRVFFHDSSF